MEKRRKSASLLPVGVFLVFYLGLGILFEYIMRIPMGFYNVPIVVAFLAALLVACLQNRKVGFDEKLEIMGRGIGDKYLLLELHAELIRKDWFMTLLDVKDYIQKKEQAYADYEDRMAWAKKMVVNIAKAGYFSSDRTIAEYNRDIWHL